MKLKSNNGAVVNCFKGFRMIFFSFVVATVPEHGSSEGHEMLKRNDKYHSIADDVPIPKM